MRKAVPQSVGDEFLLLLQQVPAFTGDMQRQEHPFPCALQDQTKGYFFSIQVAVAQQQMLQQQAVDQPLLTIRAVGFHKAVRLINGKLDVFEGQIHENTSK